MSKSNTYLIIGLLWMILANLRHDLITATLSYFVAVIYLTMSIRATNKGE